VAILNLPVADLKSKGIRRFKPCSGSPCDYTVFVVDNKISVGLKEDAVIAFSTMALKLCRPNGFPGLGIVGNEVSIALKDIDVIRIGRYTYAKTLGMSDSKVEIAIVVMAVWLV
jgi:hypothetical protein